MNHIPFLALAFVVALSLVSCSTTNQRQKRITRNPEWYNALSESDKALVSKGRIREGMGKNAVFLAWGRADSVTASTDRGKSVETWFYTTPVPHYVTGFGFSYGSYYGRGYPGFGIGHGYGAGWPGPFPYQELVYTERPAAMVRFERERVVSWQIRR